MQLSVGLPGALHEVLGRVHGSGALRRRHRCHCSPSHHGDLRHSGLSDRLLPGDHVGHHALPACVPQERVQSRPALLGSGAVDRPMAQDCVVRSLLGPSLRSATSSVALFCGRRDAGVSSAALFGAELQRSHRSEGDVAPRQRGELRQV